MKLRPIHAVVLWLLALAGLLTSAHDRLWSFLRAHGLGDHAIGALFVLIPVTLLAIEWLLLIGLPAWAFVLFRKKRRIRG